VVDGYHTHTSSPLNVSSSRCTDQYCNLLCPNVDIWSRRDRDGIFSAFCETSLESIYLALAVVKPTFFESLRVDLEVLWN
jgi:hypothetical protein